MSLRLGYSYPEPTPLSDPQAKNVDKTAQSLTHNDVLRSNTGWQLDPDRWSEAERRRSKLRAQSDALADLLEAAGVPARAESNVVSISAVTGIVTPVNAFRPIRFIPAVAARERRPMLNAFRYWIENVCEGNGHLRYIVMTTPGMVPAFGELRGSLVKLSRDISRWASEAGARFHVDVVFRGMEFTRKTAGERGIGGIPPETPLYHPHANIVLRP